MINSPFNRQEIHLAIWNLNRNPLTLCVKFYEKERKIEQSKEKMENKLLLETICYTKRQRYKTNGTLIAVHMAL